MGHQMTGYLPSAFMGADMPPRICHVPLVLIQVCVIRIASVRTTRPVSLLAQFALIDGDVAGYANGQLLN